MQHVVSLFLSLTTFFYRLMGQNISIVEGMLLFFVQLKRSFGTVSVLNRSCKVRLYLFPWTYPFLILRYVRGGRPSLNNQKATVLLFFSAMSLIDVCLQSFFCLYATQLVFKKMSKFQVQSTFPCSVLSKQTKASL